MRLRAATVFAAAAALAAAMAVGASPAETPGVTPTTVLIGGTVPLSGEAAAFGSVAAAANAYFEYVNAGGGVHGRTIEYRYYDDAYNPALTVQQTRRLVEQDLVLAVFNQVGTANNLAVRDYLNTMGVPQLFSGDGSEALAGNPAKYPWTIGFLPSFVGEGATYGRDIAKRYPKAKVAALYESTELGREMLQGLKKGLGKKGPKLVAHEAYDLAATDVQSQIVKLRATRADTLALFTTPKYFVQAIVAINKLNWKPRIYVAAHSIEPTIMAIAEANAPQLTMGAISVAFLRNPLDPKLAGDPGMSTYKDVLTRYAPEIRYTDLFNLYGVVIAWVMVETLKLAGPDLTRASLIKAARSLDTTSNPFLLPGIRIKTGPNDSHALDHFYLYRYDNVKWAQIAGPIPAR
ncbi:MAG: branched-chain amino acid ABC transporter substrate-binding protein [Thermoleophilia bacterium]|nr:branched-chain amino acid ABC transporter substrate-binding protein [Thermoleophilia bacterium]